MKAVEAVSEQGPEKPNIDVMNVIKDALDTKHLLIDHKVYMI